MKESLHANQETDNTRSFRKKDVTDYKGLWICQYEAPRNMTKNQIEVNFVRAVVSMKDNKLKLIKWAADFSCQLDFNKQQIKILIGLLINSKWQYKSKPIVIYPKTLSGWSAREHLINHKKLVIVYTCYDKNELNKIEWNEIIEFYKGKTPQKAPQIKA